MIDRTKPPSVEDTPGLAWRLFKHGWDARWRARGDLVSRGFTPKSVRLWFGWEPTAVDRAYISDRCRALQDEMLVWGRGGLPTISAYDGTFRTLIDCYQTDPDSRFHKLRYTTKAGYSHLIKSILPECGDVPIADTKARMVLRWHEAWGSDGKVAMGHSCVGMLRTLIGFGATILDCKHCERLSGILHKMKFKMARPRNERLTADQAQAVRTMAHEMGYPSVALAQALQFELMLRQKDVIGEWVPTSEPGPPSDVIAGNAKWLRGIRWSEIDDKLILRHTTSKRQKDIEVNLRLAPMVIEELTRQHGMVLPASGPIIVYELIGRPYTAHQFRYVWRKIADKCGIPKGVYNMDSRAGAISEATDAGAELEHVRHAATHSDIGMTQRYSRAGAEKTATVMQLRAAHRNKTGT